MMTQCPTCGKCYDIPDKAVIKHAARIMQRHSRKGTPAQIEASRANGRLSHGRPRPCTLQSPRQKGARHEQAIHF